MNRFNLVTMVGLVWVVGSVVQPASAQHGNHGHEGHGHGNHDHGSHAKKAVLPNCPVANEPINLALSIPTDDGPVYFCCKGCISLYKENPTKYATKVASQRKALADRPKVQVTCPVTKEPVDKKVFVETNGEKVYLCCKGCAKKYKSDPAKYAGALANSYTFQTKCPVMGGDINPKVSTTLSTGETIYYCCAGCDKPLRKNPAKYNKNLISQGIVINWTAVKNADSKKGHHDGHDHGSHGHDGHDH